MAKNNNKPYHKVLLSRSYIEEEVRKVMVSEEMWLSPSEIEKVIDVCRQRGVDTDIRDTVYAQYYQGYCE